MLPNLKVENLSCVRSEKTIFENISFEVLPGENIEDIIADIDQAIRKAT